MPKKRGLIRERLGFTLIELLAVVSIISVLSVIAMPQYSRFKQRVYDSAAMSDMTQFRSAIVDMDPPVAFGGVDTAGPHPTLTTVTISQGVNIFNVFFEFGADFILLSIGCHDGGSTGYLMVVPYGNSNPWAGFAEANQIVESPAYRWPCGL